MAPGIDLQGANLVYENHVLFQNLNLSIPAAEWTCLLGPSGIGKSSLLRLIAGLNTFAELKTIKATDGLPLGDRIAYMAQQDTLLPWLNIIDNILLGRKLRGELIKKEDVENAQFLLQKVGLGKQTTLKPALLSGGMKQRAVLARTLFEDRKIILMDEPFASLDVITRAYIQELAAELLTNKTVLLVTHDPMEALRLGHHVFIMKGMPAKISVELKLQGKPLRKLTDTVLLETHALILEELSHAKESKLE